MYSPRRTLSIGSVSGAYDFDDIICESASTTDGTVGFCWVNAKRVSTPTIINVILPSILFVLIAVFTLSLDVKLAMPRIAGALFALLILSSYRNATVSQLPESATFTWIDLYLLVCAIVVWVVILCHVVASYLHDAKYHKAQASFDRTMRLAVPILLILGATLVTMVTFYDNHAYVGGVAASILVVLLCLPLLFLVFLRKAYRNDRSRNRDSFVHAKDGLNEQKSLTRSRWRSFGIAALNKWVGHLESDVSAVELRDFSAEAADEYLDVTVGGQVHQV